ncbi:ABC transporter substrate-binding protein [Crocosphaera sp. UHCC 0190]|uniref:ABC transporter substrate-binding protein n=1 Tax=Crocosphaera sp. UHCC 0190 TaxID=3110246 RepID=UPI002B1F97C6|nr:ABC transporter substrate-binding protein [Crocosphaera sp. UHCC 0190]MEA5511388.1 ABC transporter substrate-binding protein [Crocosphaera sp. UHCC 0190]
MNYPYEPKFSVKSRLIKSKISKRDSVTIAMKLISKFFVVFATLLCICLLIHPKLVYAQSQQLIYAEPQPIKIGMSAAFTGASRSLGIELYQGSMAYFDYINRSGGIKGRPIVIQAYDDGYNPLPAIQNTTRLIEKDQVFLLFNYLGTPTVTRVLPLFIKYQNKPIFLFFPFTGAQSHRQSPYNQFVFNLRPSYREETAGLVKNFLKIGRKKIAVFYQIDAYGRSGWDGVKRQLKAEGFKIVGEATYRRGTEYHSSFKAQVDILKKAEPDAIISIGSYQACAGFIRDARTSNWDVPIANLSFVGSESLLDLLLKTSRSTGIDYTQNLINSQVVPSYENIALPGVKEYRNLRDAYQQKPPPNLVPEPYQNLPYSFVSFEGFLNAKLLVKILQDSPNLSDRKNLKTTLENIHDFDLGLDVPVEFNAQSHQGLHKIYYMTVKDNHFVPIFSWKQWSK